jgi:hypothetical protein
MVQQEEAKLEHDFLPLISPKCCFQLVCKHLEILETHTVDDDFGICFWQWTTKQQRFSLHSLRNI